MSRFKVGDRVRLVELISSNAKYNSFPLGTTFLVLGETDSFEHNVNIKGLSVNYKGWFNKNELELVEEPEYTVGVDLGSESNIKSNSKINKIMNKVSTFIKNSTLSKEEKLLRKHDLHNDCGDNTQDAKTVILEKFYNSAENQAYLLEIAEGLELEAKENK